MGPGATRVPKQKIRALPTNLHVSEAPLRPPGPADQKMPERAGAHGCFRGLIGVP